MANKNRFVKLNTVRLVLSEGDWIDVKEELTYGEEQRMAGVGLTSLRTPEQVGNEPVRPHEIGINLELFNIEKILMWCLDWSFVDENDKRVKLDRSSVSALQPETAQEILDALMAHVEKLEEDRKNVKNTGVPEGIVKTLV